MMKTIDRLRICIIITGFVLASSISSFAQPQGNDRNGYKDHNGFMKIPGLTDDQKTKINGLLLEQMKSVKPLKNQLRENLAHYKTLMSADSPDMNAINKSIDESGKIKVDIMKLRARHIQDIRALLTDDQKIYFDTKAEKWHHRRAMKGKIDMDGREG